MYTLPQCARASARRSRRRTPPTWASPSVGAGSSWRRNANAATRPSDHVHHQAGRGHSRIAGQGGGPVPRPEWGVPRRTRPGARSAPEDAGKPERAITTMKKPMTRETTCCDVCGDVIEICGTKCDNCGKDFCYECEKKHIVSYAHGIHVGGSGDAHWCVPCDHQLHLDADLRHLAFETIKKLRAEGAAWHRDYHERCRAAEERVEQMNQRWERAKNAE